MDILEGKKKNLLINLGWASNPLGIATEPSPIFFKLSLLYEVSKSKFLVPGAKSPDFMFFHFPEKKVEDKNV